MNDEQIQQNWEEYKKLLLSTNRKNIENIINWLDESDFKYAPASTQYHNAFRGGLLKHSLNVYYATKDFKNWIDFFEIPEESLIITALLHDICKVNCYDVVSRNTKDENGNWIQVPYYIWNEQVPYGHSEKSIILILKNGIELNDVEIAMIRNHMGFTASGDDERRVSKLFRICPQSLVLYLADIEATMILESFDGPKRFLDKLGSNKNISESLDGNKKLKNTVVIDGTTYVVAPEDSVVDNTNIIELFYNNTKIKVFSPYGDRFTILN